MSEEKAKLTKRWLQLPNGKTVLVEVKVVKKPKPTQKEPPPTPADS